MNDVLDEGRIDPDIAEAEGARDRVGTPITWRNPRTGKLKELRPFALSDQLIWQQLDLILSLGEPGKRATMVYILSRPSTVIRKMWRRTQWTQEAVFPDGADPDDDTLPDIVKTARKCPLADNIVEWMDKTFSGVGDMADAEAAYSEVWLRLDACRIKPRDDAGDDDDADAGEEKKT